jgi:hypothetical protein
MFHETYSPIIKLWVLTERQAEIERGEETDRQDEVHRHTFVTFFIDALQVRHFHREFSIYYY